MSQTTQSWWFVFYKDQLLLEKKGNGTFALPCGEIPPIVIKEKTTVHTITTLEGKNCKSFSARIYRGIRAICNDRTSCFL